MIQVIMLSSQNELLEFENLRGKCNMNFYKIVQKSLFKNKKVEFKVDFCELSFQKLVN